MSTMAAQDEGWREQGMPRELFCRGLKSPSDDLVQLKIRLNVLTNRETLGSFCSFVEPSLDNVTDEVKAGRYRTYRLLH